MNTLARISLAALLLASAPAYAAQTPAPGHLDPRIRTVLYNPDQVTRVVGFPNYQITIQFESGERIENVALGDSVGWQVTPNKKANLLFVKPMTGSGNTNMSVVTDRRTYNFELVGKPGREANKAGLMFSLRFTYPIQPRPVQVAKAPAAPTPQISPETLNFAYKLKGARVNRPVRIYDDGRSTYFQWDAGSPTPAIFAVGPDKRESLVNSRVKGQVVIVDRVGQQFALRHGKHVTYVINEGSHPSAPPQSQPQPQSQVARRGSPNALTFE